MEIASCDPVCECHVVAAAAVAVVMYQQVVTADADCTLLLSCFLCTHAGKPCCCCIMELRAWSPSASNSAMVEWWSFSAGPSFCDHDLCHCDFETHIPLSLQTRGAIDIQAREGRSGCTFNLQLSIN